MFQGAYYFKLSGFVSLSDAASIALSYQLLDDDIHFRKHRKDASFIQFMRSFSRSILKNLHGRYKNLVAQIPLVPSIFKEDSGVEFIHYGSTFDFCCKDCKVEVTGDLPGFFFPSL